MDNKVRLAGIKKLIFNSNLKYIKDQKVYIDQLIDRRGLMLDFREACVDKNPLFLNRSLNAKIGSYTRRIREYQELSKRKEIENNTLYVDYITADPLSPLFLPV